MSIRTYSTMSSMRIPKELTEQINFLKILPEEPNYKVVQRILSFFMEHHGDKRATETLFENRMEKVPPEESLE